MRCDRKWILALVVLFAAIPSPVRSSTNEVLVYRKKYIMGTVFEIAAYDSSTEHASNAIEKAFQEIVRIDDVLSNYKADSALSNLNRSAHFHAEKVPADLYLVIDESVKFSKLSEGKFDVSVGPLVDLWKAALTGGSLPSPAQQEKARACVGYQKIHLSPPDHITFESTCLQLDLGGIGKGYAVDRAAEILRLAGIRNALINAGGSTLYAMGSPPNRAGWLLHLRDPSRMIDPQITISDESVSTSEQSAPSVLANDSAGHIIDPDTGMPLRTDFAVSVVARTGTASDGLSTCLLLLGPTKGQIMLKSMPGVSAVWISPRAEVTTAGNRILVRKGI